MTSSPTSPQFSPEKEYYSLFETVNDFDKRLMVVKGWSVTLSLVALGSAFQFQHQGLFVAAVLTSMGFWILDGAMKQHQMRYYVRMRDIEVASARGRRVTSPLIDWSWSIAPLYLRKAPPEGTPEPIGYGEGEAPQSKFKLSSYNFVWFMPHVLLPHAIGFIGGSVLLALALANAFGEFRW